MPNILFMDKLIGYIRNSYDELIHRVTWPSLDELTRSAILVLFASLIIALVVFLMDSGIEWVMKVIYGVLSGGNN